MESKKSNIVQSINIHLDVKEYYNDIYLDIRFPVKRIKFISSLYRSDDMTSISCILTSNIPNTSVLSVFEEQRSFDNKSFTSLSGVKNCNGRYEYVFDQPIKISGVYRFSLLHMTGIPFTQYFPGSVGGYVSQQYDILLNLDFRQE